MSNLVYFRLNSPFPLSHVTVATVNERLRAEPLIILRFERISKSNDDDIESRYIWRYKINCKWSRDCLIGGTVILNSYPLAPNLHPICGLYLTPDLFHSRKIPLGFTDNDWCRFLGKSFSTVQTLTVTYVSSKRPFSRVPNGKNNRSVIMKYVADYLRRSQLDASSKIWMGPSYGIPRWALVLTDYMFSTCENQILKYYEIFASCVTPTFGVDADIRHKLLKCARHACFASRTIANEISTTKSKNCCGNLCFSRANDTLAVNCEMTKVLYSYHCSKSLRNLKWTTYEEVFQRYRESILEVLDVETGKIRPAFGYVSQRLLNSCIRNDKVHLGNFDDELLFLFQFTEEDLLWSDEYSIPCTRTTTAVLSDCHKRISFERWRNKYKIVRVIFQSNNDDAEQGTELPCIVEFDPELELLRERYIREEISVKIWAPTKLEYSQLQKPLKYALAKCRMVNCQALQIKPPKLNYKSKRSIEKDIKSSVVAYGSTPYFGPNIETVFDRADQTLEIKYYDVWGRRDFFTVCLFDPTY